MGGCWEVGSLGASLYDRIRRINYFDSDMGQWVSVRVGENDSHPLPGDPISPSPEARAQYPASENHNPPSYSPYAYHSWHTEDRNTNIFFTFMHLPTTDSHCVMVATCVRDAS